MDVEGNAKLEHKILLFRIEKHTLNPKEVSMAYY